MPLIVSVQSGCSSDLIHVPVRVDRHTLAKRRWRIQAEDGEDIAVDLENPCSHGDLLWTTELKAYFVDQAFEQVVEIPMPADPGLAATLGWFLGNQHLPVEIMHEGIRLEASSHLMSLLERSHIDFSVREAVFSPAAHSASHSHNHGHSHHH